MSRPYLYSVFSGEALPFVPDKQFLLADILGLNESDRSLLFDLAAEERGEMPADIVLLVRNPEARTTIRGMLGHEAEDKGNVSSSLSLDSKIQSLRVPCCYQGCKQRVASELVDTLLSMSKPVDTDTMFFDLCCGSGAVTIELLNRGFNPNNVVMLDISSWGAFWSAIGQGRFDLERFKEMLQMIPEDKRKVRDYMTRFSRDAICDDECYRYIILQSCSFGGKQIWREGGSWRNAFFRDYWEPKPDSVRKSPANPMQPSPKTLYKRIEELCSHCAGVQCVNDDIRVMLDWPIPDNSIVYIDTPYRNSTGYAYGFDVDGFASSLSRICGADIFVSEGIPLSDCSKRLNFGGAKGGISGNKCGKHQEWLSKIDGTVKTNEQ